MRTLVEASLTEEERRVLDRWLELMRAELDVVGVWLFGSRARGEGGPPDSDIDLLVITRGDRRRDAERVHELVFQAAAEENANPAPFVTHTWDREWLRNRREIRSFFIQEVDRDKIVLLGES
jgi:predicted nucleotidyltransferase